MIIIQCGCIMSTKKKPAGSKKGSKTRFKKLKIKLDNYFLHDRMSSCVQKPSAFQHSHRKYFITASQNCQQRSEKTNNAPGRIITL